MKDTQDISAFMTSDLPTHGFPLIQALTKNFGDPVNMTNEEAKQYLQEHVINRPLSSDTFYAVMDLKKLAFTFSHGTESFLGIQELTFPFFLEQIEESFRDLFLIWGEAGYIAAFDPQNKKVVQPLKQEYRTMIPMRNRAGKFYWITQIALPLQLDADNNLLSHLNIYRVGMAYEDWQNWAVKGEILEKNLPRKDFAVKMDEYVHQYFLTLFGQKKLQILQHYAGGKNTAEVAHQLSITKQTLYTHNKDILGKANRLFYAQYSNVKEAALHLEQMGYL